MGSIQDIKTSSSGIKVQWPFAKCFIYDTIPARLTTMLDIVRLLAQAQKNLSGVQHHNALSRIRRSAKRAELVSYSYRSSLVSVPQMIVARFPLGTLASALRVYAQNSGPGMAIFRELVRRGAGIHALVRKTMGSLVDQAQ